MRPERRSGGRQTATGRDLAAGSFPYLFVSLLTETVKEERQFPLEVEMDAYQKIEILQGRIRLFANCEAQQRQDQDSLIQVHEKGGLPDWPEEAIAEAILRYDKMIAETVVEREKVEVNLAKEMAELDVPRCIRCNLIPIGDGVRLCVTCARECAAAVGKFLRERRYEQVGESLQKVLGVVQKLENSPQQNTE